MGQLVALMVASGVMGLMALPMVQLALMPAQASRQKSSYAVAEAKAIAVRKEAAASESLVSLTIPEGCVQKQNAAPQGEMDSVPNFVECTAGEGKNQAVAWQPLYALSDLQPSGDVQAANEEANICYSLYDSNGDWQSDKNRLPTSGQDIYRGKPSDIASLAVKYPPGEAVSRNAELYLRIHEISAAACQGHDSSIRPSQLLAAGNADKICAVPNLINSRYQSNPNGQSWNDSGGKITGKDWKKNKQESVKDQSPEPGDSVSCTASLTLDFGD